LECWSVGVLECWSVGVLVGLEQFVGLFPILPYSITP